MSTAISVVQAFEQVVSTCPEALAISVDSTRLTYADLNAAANRLARALVLRQGSHAEPVAILLDRGSAVLIAILGVLKAGKAYVALDPSQPTEFLGRILGDLEAGLLVTDAAHQAMAATLFAAATFPGEVHSIICSDRLEPDLADTNLDQPVRAEDLAGIFYTSGSTGDPKGVLWQHDQILHAARHDIVAYGISNSDRCSLLGFPGFGASMLDIFDALLSGATLCIFDPRRQSLAALVLWLRDEQITILHPSVELFRQITTHLTGSDDFAHVRLVILGGQAVYPQDVAIFQRRFDAGCVLVHRLASTETGIIAHQILTHQTSIGEVVPVGYALPGKEILLLDDAGRVLPPGEEGQIALRSCYLPSGYWRKPELTAAKYVADPQDAASVICLTGDVGRFTPEGALVYLGRTDHLVKIRGYRVQLEEIDLALRRLPYLRQAATKIVQSRTGERLVGYVAPQPGHALTSSQLRQDLGRTLPDYMLPTAWCILDELPVTASGKIDWVALPPPGALRPNLATPFIAPRSELEQQLAGIWADLLELDEVGVEDDFFALGGDSLAALRMALTVEEATGQRVPTDFLAVPTVAHLAGVLVQGSAASQAAAGEANPPSQVTASREPARSLRGRLRTQAIEIGPLWHGHGLPYGVGVRLQRWLIAQPLVRRRYARQLALVERWSAELGIADAGLKEDGIEAGEERAIISWLANTWLEWRRVTLARVANLSDWVTVNDPYHSLSESSPASVGMVLALSHTGRIGLLPLEICQRHGRETGSVVGGARVGPQVRSELLLKAERILRGGGVVMVAADGYQGQQTVDVPFWGRRRPFQIGAAELAVTTGSALVPVYITFDAQGRITFEVIAPLETQALTTRDRIRDLTERYGADYAARWPQCYISMRWHHLAHNLNLPSW